MAARKISKSDFKKALEWGRPPNVKKLFPNSKALVVSGKVVDRAMMAKGNAMTIAANGRSNFIIRGTLRAAQRANAAIIIEIAKSEGGASSYCATNYWNMAAQVDHACNEMGITVPVAVHADHYGVKSDKDVSAALVEIPTMFEAGLTSIAIDASHMPDDQNLMANIRLNAVVPAWAGYETEVGEIKGEQGLSTPAEAAFLIKGLNAHGIHPDWIALNNGTTHGLEASGLGIQVDLTARVHDAVAAWGISGAQHGTSGNSFERLREIASRTKTTKANVATALQFVSWGVDVNEYGNAIIDETGNFIKKSGVGITDAMWADIRSYAEQKGWKKGDYKKLNLPFENKLMGQSSEVRESMISEVEKFVFHLLSEVFNATDTAPLAIKAILDAKSHDLGPKASRTEDPAEWTPEKIMEKAANLDADKGPEGDFED